MYKDDLVKSPASCQILKPEALKLFIQGLIATNKFMNETASGPQKYRYRNLNPLPPEFRKNSFNPTGKLQLFRSVKLIETHGIMKITKKIHII